MSQITLSPKLVSSYELEGYEDRPMLPTEIASMFKDHGQLYVMSDGVVLVIEDYAGHVVEEKEYINTTGWTLFNVLNFLNY